MRMLLSSYFKSVLYTTMYYFHVDVVIIPFQVCVIRYDVLVPLTCLGFQSGLVMPTGICFTGMGSRDFRGISSIQEVECWGGNLNTDVKLMSLQMYALPESTVLASLNVYTNNCMTFGDYAACVIHPTDTHKSKIRVLVHDLEEGTSREFGCTANTLNSMGNPMVSTWSLLVKRDSKYACVFLWGTRNMVMGDCVFCSLIGNQHDWMLDIYV